MSMDISTENILVEILVGIKTAATTLAKNAILYLVRRDLMC